LSAQAGDSIPGGPEGIVLYTDGCIGFAAAELMLHDEDGMMVSFDVVPLPGGAVLLRPKSPLPAGVYDLKFAGMSAAPVIADAPADVPTKLGTLTSQGVTCGASFSLALDPLLREYLPQLKLSVSVDGSAEQTWFDYGTLDAASGSAQLSLANCFPTCLAAGSHTLHVVPELAGHDGTLEPIEVVFDTTCSASPAASAAASTAAPAAAPAEEPEKMSRACQVGTGGSGVAASVALLSTLCLFGAGLGRGRPRRSG
jgi:hypothetical protein